MDQEEAEGLEAVLDVHEELPQCMEEYCTQPRWIHPERGELVLCKGHAEAVFRGEAKAPPLRRTRDYQSIGRKTFLVEALPGSVPDTPLETGERDRQMLARPEDRQLLASLVKEFGDRLRGRKAEP